MSTYTGSRQLQPILILFPIQADEHNTIQKTGHKGLKELLQHLPRAAVPKQGYIKPDQGVPEI
jgi:hypothetical protein